MANTPLHVTLVRPPVLLQPEAFVGSQAAPSLALALLGGVCEKAGHRVTAIDATGERFDQYLPVGDTGLIAHGLTIDEIIARIPGDSDLIGVSSMFTNEWIHHKHVVAAICEAFPHVPVVAGGEHATAAGGYILRCCPGVAACCVGEGEQTLLDLLDAVAEKRPFTTVPGLLVRDEHGTPVRTVDQDRVKRLDELPWPAWHLVPINTYLDAGAGHGVVGRRSMPMLASRGCPYKCTFCSNPQMWGKLWNIREAKDVVAEMAYYKERYQAECFSFYDLTAIIRKSWILEFTQLLESAQLEVQWILPSGTRSEALDDEVIAAMKRTGCYSLHLAPESGSPETLARIKKKVNLEKMLMSIRACAREGLFARANIIFGFPGERPRDMLKSMLFLVRLSWNGLHDVGIFPFTPYPGSQLHDELRAKNAFPPDGEEYDLLMAANLNNNYMHPRSWNEYVSDGQLRMLLITGAVLFYSTQFLFRPWRFLGFMKRVISMNPSTNGERVLVNLFQRFKKLSPASRPGNLTKRAARPAE
jgi:radical SAM superfamily enzyme YgiQ (UPF0313 family)